MNDFVNFRIAVIGQGYVGLPLALAFSKKREVVGYDIDVNRIKDLRAGIDKSEQVSGAELLAAKNLKLTSDPNALFDCDVFIVTVPTPVDENLQPDLRYLVSASRLVGTSMKKGSIVIYESTVFPGATEEVCVPELEAQSGYKYNEDFFVGYSPERINPSDKDNKLENIVKVTSGSNAQTASIVDKLYQSIITAGTFKAASIKVAEASKVIENTQRDVNIALMNEFSRIFRALEIDTSDVLKAAETKWNFLKFVPGFVGGHCISVDPYYLIHRSEEAGYQPSLISTARSVNEAMPELVAGDIIKELEKVPCSDDPDCLIVGATFKANCPDFRNTKVPAMLKQLRHNGLKVELYDPFIDRDEWRKEYDFELIEALTDKKYRVIVFCNEHDFIRDLGIEYWKGLLVDHGQIFDLKSIFENKHTEYRL